MKDWLRYQIPVLLILAVSLSVTTLLWQREQRHVAIDQQRSFDFSLRELTGSIGQRMAAYEQVLHGAQALYGAFEQVERSEFRDYIDALRLGANYSGLEEVGVLLIVPDAQKDAHIAAMRKQGFPNYTIKPEGRRDIYAPLVQIEPLFTRRLLALGQDPYPDPVRRSAMEQACDSGVPAITGKVNAMGETEADVQPGFMMFLPIYRKGARSDTITARRTNIVGWVIASFRMNTLMAGLYSRHAAMVDVKVYDGVEMTPQALLYGSPVTSDKPRNAHNIKATEYLEVGGRTWTMVVRPLPGFNVLRGENSARLIAMGGVTLSVLLSLLTWVLLSGRAHAMALAQKMTQELRESEARFRHQAQHDTLTGLPNRALFSDRLEQAIAQAKRYRKRLALMFIDLDGFKPINDNLGHHAGDCLLKEVATRMQQHVRASDTIARIGGDEFVVLLSSIEETQDALALAEIIRRTIGQPFETPDGKTLSVSCSIGVAVYPENGCDEIQLSRNADRAMYYAKQSGRNTVLVCQAKTSP